MTAGFPLARFTVDRAAHLRSSSSWFEELAVNSSTRFVLIHDGMVAVTDELSLHLVKPESLGNLTELEPRAVLLGLDDEHAFLGVTVEHRDESVAVWATVREIGATMSARDVGLAITATALSTWHSTHQHCPRCGTLTRSTEAGWSRTCDNDGLQHFPRTEPAVIVAVEDHAGRLLLGQRTNWPGNWFSILAGFVEAGESCESAVIREIKEEARVSIDASTLRYQGSQPWPFPASLMLAYRATADSSEMQPDGTEIAQLQWVSHSEFEQACDSGAIRLPNPASIAWHIIERWYGKPLKAQWSRG